MEQKANNNDVGVQMLWNAPLRQHDRGLRQWKQAEKSMCENNSLLLPLSQHQLSALLHAVGGMGMSTPCSACPSSGASSCQSAHSISAHSISQPIAHIIIAKPPQTRAHSTEHVST